MSVHGPESRVDSSPPPPRRDKATKRILSGRLEWEVARFGVPLAVGMGLQVTLNLVDAYILSRLQPEVAGPALGAIGICDQIAAIGTIISYGVSTATATLLSQYQGRADPERVRAAARSSMRVVAVLSVVFGVAGLWIPHVIIQDIIGAKGEVARLSIDYLRVIMAGNFSIFFLLQLTSIQRALGSSKTPVALLVGSNVLNFFLSVLLVYGPGPAPSLFSWGPPLARLLHLPRIELMGAAWSTVLSRTAVLVPLILVVERRFRLFRGHVSLPARRAMTRRLLDLAWPASAQFVVRLTAMLITHALVARAFTTQLDQRASTALGIVFRLETLALFVGMGWGSAAQTFLGQNQGAQQWLRAKRSAWVAAGYNLLFMFGLASLLVAFGPAIVRFFDPDPVVVAIATQYLRVVAPSYLALGISIVLGNAMMGAGATKVALALDGLLVLLFQLPWSLWAVHGAHASPTRLWWVLALTNLVGALLYVLTFRDGRFLQRQRF